MGTATKQTREKIVRSAKHSTAGRGDGMADIDRDPDYVFFPSEYGEDIVSYLYPGMYLGSTDGAMALEILQQHKITHILTLGSNAAPKSTFSNVFKYLTCDMSDCPTQVLFEALEFCFKFIDECYQQNGNVFVHCGRGISRSSSVAISYLMRAQKVSFGDAYALVSAKRPCAFPNVGFQIQLQLFEKSQYSLTHPDFNLQAEIVISIERKLREIDGVLTRVFEDADILEEHAVWRIFGFFFENCHQYLGRCDIGVPDKILVEAEDISRRLKNLNMLFDEEEASLAIRVGAVMYKWVTAQQRLTGQVADRESPEEICDRIAGYKSKLEAQVTKA